MLSIHLEDFAKVARSRRASTLIGGSVSEAVVLQEKVGKVRHNFASTLLAHCASLWSEKQRKDKVRGAASKRCVRGLIIKPYAVGLGLFYSEIIEQSRRGWGDVTHRDFCLWY